MIRLSLAVITLLATAVSVQAQDQRRPCGPGSGRNLIRLLIPQGVFGADFRPACRQHDKEYGIFGTQKAVSDHDFYDHLCEACQHSHTPRLCQLIARIFYSGVSHPLSNRFFEAGRVKSN